MPRPGWLSLPILIAIALLLTNPAFTVAQVDPPQTTTRTVNVELILDASGSMAEPLTGGERRIDTARRVLREVIGALPEREGINVGFRVYGHRGDNTEAGKAESCRSTELLVPVRGVAKAELLREIDAFQPTGWTPIAHSLEQAAGDFQPGGESITNVIVLVTDGEETCDPPAKACQAAAALRQADVAVTIHVVGFALAPEQLDLVRCVAEEGGGHLYDAGNAEELGGALVEVLEEVEVLPAATPRPAAGGAPAVPLAEIRTLVYHQITAWETGPNEGYGGQGEQAPIISDDGQRVAFTRLPVSGDPAGRNRIFVVNADGSGEREVDAYAPLCYCGSMVDLSADGSAVVSTDAEQVRIADADGGGARELIALDNNEVNGLRIAGDGRTVFFRVYRDTTVRNTSPSQPIERGIYAINADGSGLRQIVGPDQIASLLGVPADQAPFFGGTWGLDAAMDGSRVVFATLTTEIDPATGSFVQGAREGLFAAAGDGSGLHRLLAPDFTWVMNGAISGDGSTVAYVTGDFGTGYQEAGILSFDGGNQRKLTDNTEWHPMHGNNLPSGERIQLSADGSRLLLGSSGLLYDTASDAALALGVGTPFLSGDPTPLVGDGLYRATMDAGATRFLYLFQPVGEPYQLARLDLNPAALGAAPTITEARVNPAYVLTEGRSAATVSARVSTGNAFLRVGVRVLRAGLPDDNVSAAYYGPLADDGASNGDATASDGVFTTDGLSTNCCAEGGPRTVRLKAETQAADGLRHATAIDVAPFEVLLNPPSGRAGDGLRVQVPAAATTGGGREQLQPYLFTFAPYAAIPERPYPEAMVVRVESGSFAFRAGDEDIVVVDAAGSPIPILDRVDAPPNYQDRGTAVADGTGQTCTDICALPPGETVRIQPGQTVYVPRDTTCFWCNLESVDAELTVWAALPVGSDPGEFSWTRFEGVDAAAPGGVRAMLPGLLVGCLGKLT